MQIFEENNSTIIHIEQSSNESYKFEFKNLNEKEDAIYKIQSAWKAKKINVNESSQQLIDLNSKEFDTQILLAGGVEKIYHQGDVILKQGQSNTSLFYIIHGSVT